MKYDRYTYRGRTTSLGKWMFGAYVLSLTEPHIMSDKALAAVDPATVGQCTGLSDKNGTAIFEGDVLDCGQYADGEERLRIVCWSSELAMFGCQEIGHDVNEDWDGEPLGDYWINMERVGNIHDNPELLEVGT